jgi:hypothetical protein
MTELLKIPVIDIFFGERRERFWIRAGIFEKIEKTMVDFLFSN